MAVDAELELAEQRDPHLDHAPTFAVPTLAGRRSTRRHGRSATGSDGGLAPDDIDAPVRADPTCPCVAVTGR
ncbi:hypothetical protein GCM10022220_13780 [Actinocatenispora rupis]|uniref:Uncharacterized protein n=1 Tax=Actinocatenispora rupis TaxID=519421 RepID=A0A8J3N8U7_9ACTN|nr:hypothetical protein Aru02nite_15730 [Actinocatenispora rupis]